MFTRHAEEVLANSFDKAVIEAKIKPEDEKTETELNPDKIENEKSFWNTLWGALQGEYNENPTGTEILIDMGLNFKTSFFCK